STPPASSDGADWARLSAARSPPTPAWPSRWPRAMPRIRARLDHDGLLRLAPRLRSRAALHQRTVSTACAAELAADPALVRTGPSAAAAYGWSDLHDLPLDAYVPPPLVAELLASPEPGVNMPRMSGVLRTPNGAKLFLELRADCRSRRT